MRVRDLLLPGPQSNQDTQHIHHIGKDVLEHAEEDRILKPMAQILLGVC